MLNVITASTGLQPFLQVTRWEGEGQVTTVVHRSILCTVLDEHLLHVHTGSCLVSPCSVRIAADLAGLLHTIPLVQVMPVQKRDQTSAIAADIPLELETTTYYQSPRRLPSEVEPEAIRLARQTLGLYGRVGGFDKLPGAQAIGRVMHQALADSDAAPMLGAACHLIGLGPGLTPCGGDSLVGHLRGLWLMSNNAAEARRMLDHLRDALLPDIEARTTRVGAEFIGYALDGAFVEVIDQAVLALLIPTPAQGVQSTISHLLAQGETSGTDAMLGLLTCLEAQSSMPERQPCQEQQDVAATLSLSTTT